LDSSFTLAIKREEEEKEKFDNGQVFSFFYVYKL
jgi:hypothetical protein